MVLWSFFSSHNLFVPHGVACSVSLLNRYMPFVFFLIRVRCPQQVLHLGMLLLAPQGSVMQTRLRVSLSSLLAQWGSARPIVRCWKNLQHIIKDLCLTSRVYTRRKEGQCTTWPYCVKHCSVISISVHYSLEGIIPRQTFINVVHGPLLSPCQRLLQ